MKKKMLIIRFGSTTPLHKELVIFEKICDGDLENAVGVPFHDMGLASVVLTTMSPEEIMAEFQQVAASTDDVLPVIVFEVGTAAIDLEIFQSVREAIESVQLSAQTEPTQRPQSKLAIHLTLDDLLDLVNQKGIKNLSAEELQRLQDLSK